MANVLSFYETNRALEDFLEVAIHTILYIRRVYPPNIFKQHQKYNIPVYESRSPLVNAYIGKVVELIGQELDKVTLRKVIILIRKDSSDETPYERFVFDIESLISEQQIIEDGTDFIPAAGGITKTELEQTLRGFIVRVEGAQNFLKPLPEDITFSIVLEMKDGVEPMSSQSKKGIEPANWFLAEARHSAEPPSSDPTKTRLKPFQTTNLGLVQVQFLAEILDRSTSERDEGGFASSNEPSGEGKGNGKGVDLKGKSRAF